MSWTLREWLSKSRQWQNQLFYFDFDINCEKTEEVEMPVWLMRRHSLPIVDSQISKFLPGLQRWNCDLACDIGLACVFTMWLLPCLQLSVKWIFHKCWVLLHLLPFCCQVLNVPNISNIPVTLATVNVSNIQDMPRTKLAMPVWLALKPLLAYCQPPVHIFLHQAIAPSAHLLIKINESRSSFAV